MKKYCLALDLKDDPILIAEYEAYHKKIWLEIEKSILDSGIIKMEIFRTGTRMMMLMETEDSFSFDKKAATDKNNPKVEEWEALMWKYQQALPHAKSEEKWMLMERIFLLS